MKKAIVLAVLMMPCAAFAEPSATEQALGQRVLAEVNANISCTAAVLDLRKQLSEAQAELKNLKPKTGGKK